MSLLAGKVALVTGGTSGIGQATAIAFAQEGAKVVVAGRRIEEGEQTVHLIKESGGEGLFVQTDITQEEQIKALVEKTVATYGRLDCAFNNAGVEGTLNLSIVEQTVENYEYTFNANVKGVMLSMKYEIAQMLNIGGGAIVNNASMFGLVGFPGASLYTASKHAVIGLTKAAALEMAKLNVRVNAVCPGTIYTEMIDRFVGSNQQFMEQLAQMHPVGRIGRSPEVASAVVFLCSDKASFITGHSLAVDGGFTAQ